MQAESDELVFIRVDQIIRRKGLNVVDRLLASVSDLVLDEKNSRRHEDADIAATAESLIQFGQQTPIVITESLEVVKGNGTTLAARLLLSQQDAAIERVRAGTASERDKRLADQDWSKLWVVYTKLSGDELRAYAIADNKTGMLAPWNMRNVGDIFREFATAGRMDLAIGWTDRELRGFQLPTAKDDPAEKLDRADELLGKWGVEAGDVFEITGRQGMRHRLICGDCTDINNLSALMAGSMAELYLTDPPYNVAYSGGALADRREIANDDLGDNFGAWLHGVLTVAASFLSAGSAFYLFYANSESRHVFAAMHNAALQVRQCLIWKKNVAVMGRQDYQWDHEPLVFGEVPSVESAGDWLAWKGLPVGVLVHPAGYTEAFTPVCYGWKAGGPHRWFADRKQRTVLEFDRPLRSEDHPTMKPVPLISYLIGNSTRPGELVLDTFLGSGTTMYAADQCGRRCFGSELDPRYCAVILERMVASGATVNWLGKVGA